MGIVKEVKDEISRRLRTGISVTDEVILNKATEVCIGITRKHKIEIGKELDMGNPDALEEEVCKEFYWELKIHKDKLLKKIGKLYDE